MLLFSKSFLILEMKKSFNASWYIFAFSLLASIKKKLPKDFQKLPSKISDVPTNTFS